MTRMSDDDLDVLATRRSDRHRRARPRRHRDRGSRELRAALAEARTVDPDLIGWDDRKELADLFQDHVRFPIDGLSEGFYSGLIAVTQAGARRHASTIEEA